MEAIHLYQVDRGGQHLNAISSSTIIVNTWYMIVDGGGTSAMTTGCDDRYDEGYCEAAINGDDHCVDLDQLVASGYLGKVPISPTGEIVWDDGKPAGDNGTGYALRHNSQGSFSIQACESENTNEIIVTR